MSLTAFERLKEPKEKKPEQPRRPLSYKVGDVSHIGYKQQGKKALVLTGVVNRRDHGYAREERRRLALHVRQMDNAATIRSIARPRTTTADAAVAAIAAEFTTEQLDSLTELEYQMRDQGWLVGA